MMKNIIKLYLAIIIGFSFTGCSEDYFDVNTPVDSVPLDQLDMKDLMAPVLYNTMLAQYSAASVTGNYCQYFGGYGYDSAGKNEIASTWSRIYLRILPNLSLIKEKASEKGALHYHAVTLIIEAINIGLATDLWDDIPYSQAANPSIYAYPEFDSQESIYNSIFTLLNEAIQTLEAPDNSFIGMGSEDLIYGGDFEKWLKAAYTLKARFQLHLIQKGTTTPADILANLEKGFTANDDNFMMHYPVDEINPWYQGSVLTRTTGNYYIAPNDQLISMMNGTTYPFESGNITIDPRLPEIFENESPDSPWRGGMNGGSGNSSDGQALNTFFKDGGYYTESTSPIVLITYAEALLIKAEAAFLANGGTTTSTGTNTQAYTAYIDAIAANMIQIGVDGTAYMTDTAVNVGESNLMLNHIMKEKYIANILNTETFNDFRRYNFSPDVFKDLALRLELDESDDEFKGQWFRRAIYPVTERNANPNALNHEEEPTVSVWWAL